MGAALTNARGAIVDRGGAPMNARRLHGMAVRDEYEAAGNEAAALTRNAPATTGAGYGQAQAIRDNAINSARQQTVLHYQIRSQMANDMTAAAQAQDDRIRAYAELALKNRTANLDAELKKRGLDIDERQLTQQGQHMQAQEELQGQELGLRRDELTMRGENAVKDRELDQKKLDADQRKTTQEGSAQAAEIGIRQKELEQRGAIADRNAVGDLTRTYTGESVQNYLKSNDPDDLVPREKGTKSIKPGYAVTRAKRLGLDTSSFFDEDGKRTQDARDFTDVANQLKAENPDWDDDQVLQAAHDELGLGNKTKTAAADGAGDAGDPPVPGAVYDQTHGFWVVQKDGKWMKVSA